MKSTKKLAILTATVLVIVLATQMPNYANAQGNCNVSGNGTGVGPMVQKFMKINDTNRVTITYAVETKCLDKGAAAGDNMTAVYYVNATCNDASSPGSCATLSSLGTIGAYKPAANQCSKTGECTVGPVTVNSNATIPANGTPVEILSVAASLKSPPSHGNFVEINLGQVPIMTPSGFGHGHENETELEDDGMSQQDVVSPHFSIAFQIPPQIRIPPAACAVISNALTHAGISSTLIQQILAQLNCS